MEWEWEWEWVEFVTTLIAMMMSLGGEGLSYINQFELPA